MNRIPNHPILGEEKPGKEVQIFVDGRPIMARKGNDCRRFNSKRHMD